MKIILVAITCLSVKASAFAGHRTVHTSGESRLSLKDAKIAATSEAMFQCNLESVRRISEYKVEDNSNRNYCSNFGDCFPLFDYKASAEFECTELTYVLSYPCPSCF